MLSKMSHINSYIGQIPVKNIKPVMLDKIILDLATENPNTKKPMAKKSLKDIRRILISIFDYVMDNCCEITRNPGRNLTIPKNAPTEERRALTEKEQLLVVDVPHRCRKASLIMMFCGLRLGELIPLTWDDFDFANRVISVNKSVFRSSSNTYSVKNGTKNGKCRVVPIPENIINLLFDAMVSKKTEFVISKCDGEMHTPTSWQKLWKSYVKELSLNTDIDITFSPHMLRHTYATMLYSAGVEVLTASKLLGHSKIEVTLDIYTHLQNDIERLSIDKFNQYIKNNYKRLDSDV